MVSLTEPYLALHTLFPRQSVLLAVACALIVCAPETRAAPKEKPSANTPDQALLAEIDRRAGCGE